MKGVRLTNPLIPGLSSRQISRAGSQRVQAVGHYIHGFIARFGSLREAAVSLGGAVVTPLALGFGLLPLTEELAGPNGPWPFEQLHRLTLVLADWAVLQSRHFPLAYIETNYFGGVGTQAAIVWRDGVAAFGPELSETKWVDGKFVSPSYLDKAINRSLRLLGMFRGEVVDEFDAVGLGRHRSDDDWISEATSPP
jgi:hypothetical protein